MTQAPQEKIGYWWRPCDPERHIPGTLTFGHDVKPELRLLGSMQEGFEGLATLAGGDAEFRPEIILGVSSDGKEFTLVDCLRIGYSMSAYVIESFRPRIVVEGRHFESLKDIVLCQATLRLSHLSEWYQRTGRAIEHGAPDESGLPLLTLKYQKPANTIATYDSGRIEIGHDANFKFARFGGDFVVSEEASVSVFPAQPVHLYALLEECLPPVINFVALGVGQPLTIMEMRVRAEADCVGKTPEEIRMVPTLMLHGKRRFSQDDQKELFAHDMIFTAPQLGDSFDQHLTSWLRAYQEIKPVLQLFFGRVMTAETVSANSFLNSVQAAEAYHRYRREGQECSKETHRSRIKGIVAAAPQEHREWLKDKLAFSHEKNLAQRLTDLLGERASLFSLSPDDIGNLSKRIKDLRNFFTHYDQKKKDYGTGPEFYILGGLLQWVVIACLLEEAGFSRDRAHELLEQCEPFRFFRTYHLKGQPVRYFTVEEVPASEVPKIEHQ